MGIPPAASLVPPIVRGGGEPVLFREEWSAFRAQREIATSSRNRLQPEERWARRRPKENGLAAAQAS
jgi:hypothetical protein